MTIEQTAGEPVACRCGKCLGLVDVDLSDKAHPRPRVQTAGEPVAWIRGANGTMMTHAQYTRWSVERPMLVEGMQPLYAHPSAAGATEAMVEAAAKALYLRGDLSKWGTWEDEMWRYKETYYEDAKAILTAALALADEDAPGVVELEEWRVVTKDGAEDVYSRYGSASEATRSLPLRDEARKRNAPHRVMRVCLKPLANGGGEVADGR